MIRLRGISRAYRGRPALDAVDLDLPPGVTAIMGPNGCGKTTLARILLGLERPDAGTVDAPAGLRAAAVFQADALCPQLTAVANVRLVGVDAAAARAGLAATGLPDTAHDRPVSELSGGERRRVALVRALVAPGASLVVLDEPFAGIDPDAVGPLRAWTLERLAGRTALLITHDAADAEALGARLLRWHESPMSGRGDGAAEVDSKDP